MQHLRPCSPIECYISSSGKICPKVTVIKASSSFFKKTALVTCPLMAPFTICIVHHLPQKLLNGSLYCVAHRILYISSCTVPALHGFIKYMSEEQYTLLQSQTGEISCFYSPIICYTPKVTVKAIVLFCVFHLPYSMCHTNLPSSDLKGLTFKQEQQFKKKPFSRPAAHIQQT